MDSVNVFDRMIGQVFDEVFISASEDELYFVNDQMRVTFYHTQDCCEQVYIEDVVGDLRDLVGMPILLAESVTHKDETPEGLQEPSAWDESYTWTFYKFATNRGSVTVRWYGSSNGYYSESVDWSIEGSEYED